LSNCELISEELAVHTYVRLIRVSEALHGEVSKGLIRHGLTATQFSTLKVLALKGSLAQRDIAKHLLKTGGNVTVVLDNLEKQGWVERARDTEDRRLVYVTITSAGRRVFESAYPPHLARIRHAVENLGAEECGKLLELLELLSPERHLSECVCESQEAVTCR
jgi:MarR family transcriptional regulator, 2-MHQ and catechol-resistance regulon repressor